MFEMDFTFLWTGLNLLIIYYVVKRFLFKRLGAYMDKRSASIADEIRRGQALLAEGEQYRQQQASLLAQTAAKQRRLLEEAREAADREAAQIIRQAIEEARRIKEEAQAEAAREKAQIQQTLLDETAALAIACATRVMEANMDNERNRALAERFLSDKGAA